MISAQLDPLIDTNAKSYNLDPKLVGAIIMQETAGNPWLTRYEPSWQYWESPFYWASENKVSTATEKTMQAMSWGPMQIMGSVAREVGFQQELTKLCDPSYALFFSCKKLSLIMAKSQCEDDAIASWNAGSPRKNADGTYVNQSYVDGVHKYLNLFRLTP